MRVASPWLRRLVCFLLLPSLWIALSLLTDVQAVVMVPAAVLATGLSAATAHRSGGSPSAVLGSAVGTGLTMGLAFALFVVVAFAVDCGGGRTDAAC